MTSSIFRILSMCAGKQPLKENHVEQNGGGDQTVKKTHKIFHIKAIKKYFYSKTPTGDPNNQQNNHEDITAETIQRDIDQNLFCKASKDLIMLEQECYINTDDELHHDNIKQVESLYKVLEDMVFAVIKDSIKMDCENLLDQAVQAILEQEKENNRCISDIKANNPARPRKWKQKWISTVKESVDDRLKELPKDETNNSSSSLSQSFTNLGKIFKKDLTHIVNHLKQHYPDDFDVCNSYAQHYHQAFLAHTSTITEFELGDKDTFFLLCWVHNIYPNDILKDPSLAGHIDEARLKCLLPAQKIRDYESNYVSSEVLTVKSWINKSLDLEAQFWNVGKEPEKLDEAYHTELHIDVLQNFNGGVRRAMEISERLTNRLKPLLAAELVEFAKRYKSLFEEYLEKNKNQQYLWPIIIVNVNCCWNFRDFVTQNFNDAQLQRHKENMNSILLELEDLGYTVLLQNLFQDLKSHFKRISQGNGLCSYKVMSEIIEKVEKYMEPLTTLKKPCHQEMIGRVHFYVVTEYITRLMKKKVCLKNIDQLKTLANQIHENGKMIDDFFSSQDSPRIWLMPVISKIAEIIRLQDIGAIQIEVAALVEEYSDIGKKHLEGILYIKGNLSRQEVKSVVNILKYNGTKSNKNPPLFSLIKLS
ncbi:hypothetical protein XENTR_v10021764 [Xenopus tropicalis]|nr:tumor necrosis factor alpha-induced protein 2 [Xenopus tropicalis]KAE8586782.1 hypothetical protein XENTR_v10021764 [Xenopus tropicalis]|eukprot:XP_002938045.2 PREDICTED: tumor necrosis factor alpha-induced protein 2 [Xenopus tropicalis]